MQSVVLIHGAFTGGWIWRRVLPLLRREGFEVHAPTLTGFGERSHLLSRETGPALTMQDLTNFVFHENLRGFVALGHSLGGAAALALAERMPERVRGVVLLDGLVPAPGESAAEAGGLPFRAMIQAGSEGGLVRPWPLPAFGIHREDDKAWFSSLLCPTPAAFFKDPFLRHGLPADAATDRLYLRCAAQSSSLLDAQAERAAKMGFTRQEMDTGHCPMVSAPFALSETLAPWLRGLRPHAAPVLSGGCLSPAGLSDARRLRHACPRRRAACAALSPTQA